MFLVQAALAWLEENQDKSLEEIVASKDEGADEEESGAPSVQAVAAGESAKSLVCNECGKKFRTHDAATFHATKTWVYTLPLPRHIEVDQSRPEH